MRWLIVEDALRNRVGHWFEYISTFHRGLRELGDEATVLVDQEADEFIKSELDAQPILPPSIWHRMSDGTSPLRRYLRIPIHACATVVRVKRWLSRNPLPDVIFVPTVLVHHLLGWVILMKVSLKKKPVRVILFFPSTPVRFEPTRQTHSWDPSPTAELFRFLIRSLRREVEEGQVVLGVETTAMRDTLSSLTGTPFHYFPHPVVPVERTANRNRGAQARIVLGSYGGARHEKGEDVLVQAVKQHSGECSACRVVFALQCVGGQAPLWRQLPDSPEITLISSYFREGEYAERLRTTDALVLPYRRSSYGLRVSRVAVEAMVNGIPLITTRGTTLADQARQYGAAVLCEDENIDSLKAALQQMEEQYMPLQELALARMELARKHFSVAGFRRCLLDSVGDGELADLSPVESVK